MFNFSESELKHLSIHGVGNKSNEDSLIISEKEVPVSDAISGLLTTYFTRAFKDPEFYRFSHESDLRLNEVYTYVKSIFHDINALHLQSVNIAKHLYEQSNHPRIKAGEVYVALFENCTLDDEVMDVVGIFKSEQKETFLKVFPEGRSYTVDKDDGININKLDKGCLIFDAGEDTGYRVLVVDNTNKDDAQYWKERFLHLQPLEDTFFHTRTYLQMCRDFTEEALPEADKIDKLSLIQESTRYFKEEELFDKVSFQEKVLQEPELIEAFESYKEQYQQENDINIYDEFDINSEAVRKMKRVFKSVIKLDKNFHIYVHGNRNYIRKGYDEESRMNFYQLFYKEES